LSEIASVATLPRNDEKKIILQGSLIKTKQKINLINEGAK